MHFHRIKWRGEGGGRGSRDISSWGHENVVLWSRLWKLLSKIFPSRWNFNFKTVLLLPWGQLESCITSTEQTTSNMTQQKQNKTKKKRWVKMSPAAAKSNGSGCCSTSAWSHGALSVNYCLTTRRPACLSISLRRAGEQKSKLTWEEAERGSPGVIRVAWCHPWVIWPSILNAESHCWEGKKEATIENLMINNKSFPGLAYLSLANLSSERNCITVWYGNCSALAYPRSTNFYRKRFLKRAEKIINDYSNMAHGSLTVQTSVI